MLRVVASLNPEVGGPVVAAINSAISVARAGVQSGIAVVVRPGETATPWWDELQARCSRENVRLMAFPVSAARLLTRRHEPSAALAAWLMKQTRGRYDIVHAEGPWTGPCATASVLAVLGRCALVITPHEVFTPFDMAKGRLGVRLVKRMAAAAYGHAVDLIVCSSPIEINDTRSTGMPAGKLAWAYHAVLDDRGSGEPAERAPERRSGLRVGYLGRLDPKKNVDLLIDAVGRTNEQVLLRIAGRGEPRFEAALHHRAERLLPGRFDFSGWVAESDKSAFFAGIDVLAMPSKYECFGVAAIEALAAGVPVIVSDRVGVADIVQGHEAGLVVEPTTEAILGALRRYQDDPRARMEDAKRARPAALAEASFAAHGSRLVSLYSRLLEGIPE